MCETKNKWMLLGQLFLMEYYVSENRSGTHLFIRFFDDLWILYKSGETFTVELITSVPWKKMLRWERIIGKCVNLIT